MPYVMLADFSPVLAVRRVGIADVDAVASMLQWVDTRLAEGRDKKALVYDAGRDPEGQPDAKARRVGGDWFKQNRNALPRTCVGIDFSFPSSISRGALTAVFWIAKPSVPHALHASCRAAVDQAIERAGVRSRVHPREVLVALDELSAKNF